MRMVQIMGQVQIVGWNYIGKKERKDSLKKG